MNQFLQEVLGHKKTQTFLLFLVVSLVVILLEEVINFNNDVCEVRDALLPPLLQKKSILQAFLAVVIFIRVVVVAGVEVVIDLICIIIYLDLGYQNSNRILVILLGLNAINGLIREFNK